jgi:predicted GIY-YIG superfamily endonuclease
MLWDLEFRIKSGQNGKCQNKYIKYVNVFLENINQVFFIKTNMSSIKQIKRWTKIEKLNYGNK